MPGVPSSRACDACRKAKKRCDLLQPLCTRCKRLNIPCVGAGKQRFKFAPNTMASCPKIANAKALRQSPTIARYCDSQPAWPLSNEVTLASGSFISTLVISDPRYDVTNLGGFMQHIPQRLGRNRALDLSVRVFVAAMASVRRGEVDLQVLVDYGNAMKVTRSYLAIRHKTQSPETLVAVYLLSLCQAYIQGDTGDGAIHMRGLAHLVEAASDDDWKDAFHREVLISSAFCVMFANIIDPAQKVPMTLGRLTRLVYGPAKDPSLFTGFEVHSLQFETLERLPILMETPELHVAELQSVYIVMASEARRICELVNQFVKSCGHLNFACPASELKTYFSCETINMMLLSLVCILNKILREADPENTALKPDFEFLTSQCVLAVERSTPFQPLGCSLSPLCLIILRATTDGNVACSSLTRRTGLGKDALSAKFLGLGNLLEAKLRHVEKTFACQRGEVTPNEIHRDSRHQPVDTKIQCTIL